MKNSLFIGRPFGIKVTIHWTFLILILWVVFVARRNGSNILEILYSVIFVLTIFGCVILHELGHALAARRYGINTRGITLLPIGGVASLDKIPEEPQRELFVAIAGPLVNVGIAALISLILFFLNFSFFPFDPLSARYNQFLPSLMMVNIILVLFNIIPAFPMDGGRIFRALLSFKLNRVKATNVAAKTGQTFAVLFAVYGLWNHNYFLMFIALFVFLAAQAEYKAVKQKALLNGKRVKDLVIRDFFLIQPGDTLKFISERITDGKEEEFVVVENNSPVGMISKENIMKGLSEYGENSPVERIMQRDFFTVNTEDQVKDVYEKMQKTNFLVIPVENEGKLVGILDANKINEFMMYSEKING